MAKFARCGYGSQGQGLGKTTNGYTYIVNDNVRTGDRIQVVATSRLGRKFATTAVPLPHSIYAENTLKGQLAKQEVESNTGGKGATRTYTGAEVGLERKGVSQKQYQQDVRGANLAMYKQANPNEKVDFTQKAQETFDSYSKQFMKGEQ